VSRLISASDPQCPYIDDSSAKAALAATVPCRFEVEDLARIVGVMVAARPVYKAFISYSHAADGKLAPALRSSLEGFAKPWNQIRAMRVFLDKASLSANPELWGTIERSLNGSEYFVLLASP